MIHNCFVWHFCKNKALSKLNPENLEKSNPFTPKLNYYRTSNCQWSTLKQFLIRKQKFQVMQSTNKKETLQKSQSALQQSLSRYYAENKTRSSAIIFFFSFFYQQFLKKPTQTQFTIWFRAQQRFVTQKSKNNCYAMVTTKPQNSFFVINHPKKNLWNQNLL